MIRFAILLLIVMVSSSCGKDSNDTNNNVVIDVTPPVITITAPAEGSTLMKGQSYPVQGTVTDDTELAEINVGGVKITTFDSATKHTIANVNLPIPATTTETAGSFTVTATDKEGNTATKTVTFKIN